MLNPHSKQAEFIVSQKRFKTVRAGRKGGKTAVAIETIGFKSTTSVKRLKLTKSVFASGRKVLYIAPTQDQARNIIWEALKTRLHGIAKFNEQRMQASVPNEDGEKTTIFVGGYENRENYRGLTDVIHITFDEVDTLKDFMLSWREIFRPMFLDTGGTADFIGTPKKESRNLQRLEKEFKEMGMDYQSFHFTSRDNPYISKEEIDSMEKEYASDRNAYRQEVLAEYVEDSGALFNFASLLDVFSNTVVKNGQKYLIIDIGGEYSDSDKSVFSFWDGLEEYKREEFQGLGEYEIKMKIRECASKEQIPFSHILVDSIGIGEGLPSDPLLIGIIGYKSSYGAIKTENDIARLPNVHYSKDAPLISSYVNLRSQCIFKLASYCNDHKIASRVDGKFKDNIIEELPIYQDASKGDGKKLAMSKDEVKVILGRSPDHSDTWIMRMYFEIVNKMLLGKSEQHTSAIQRQNDQFNLRHANRNKNSTK